MGVVGPGRGEVAAQPGAEVREFRVLDFEALVRERILGGV